MTPTILTLIVTAVTTPLITLITLWVKTRDSAQVRADNKIEGYINDLRQDNTTLAIRIENLEKQLDEKELRIRTIETELKNRDAEYVKLYQSYTTLKASYEVLQIDHDTLKKNYDATSAELGQLKEDIKEKAQEAAHSIAKI